MLSQPERLHESAPPTVEAVDEIKQVLSGAAAGLLVASGLGAAVVPALAIAAGTGVVFAIAKNVAANSHSIR